MNRTDVIIAAVVLALGVSLAGYFAGRGFLLSRTADRFVTVKGVAEREVESDLALWPLRVSATNNDLGRAQAELNRNVREIYRFLVRNDIDTSGAEVLGLEVTDRLAQVYGGEGYSGTRFIVQQTIIVRSENPAAMQAASQRMGELVEAGVVLSSGTGYGPAQPTFLFTRLNDVKPEMIAEATQNAREAAEQFAADSQARVGDIRQANQGVFVILPRDQAPGVSAETQRWKTVRVVSTIDYYLK